ncbi:fungal-specific transcription factor domain-containing protein [Mucidula mucida]|nr:fungal-specific transcription factor domain-containing protein [Mucidula mucida]
MYPKKRRVQRACDVCRQKKSDGEYETNTECSYCEEYGHKCTYIGTGQKKGPSKECVPVAGYIRYSRTYRYVEELERKVERLSALLQQFMSKSDIAKALSSNVDSLTETSLEPFRTSSKPFPSSPSGPGRRGYNIAEEQLLADDLADMRLADTLNKLTHDVPEFRYWGSSVGINLVKMTHDLKYANETKPLPQTPLYRKRSEFWSLQPWEVEKRSRPPTCAPTVYIFPEDDLMQELIELYFSCIEIINPLLHRPTFERSIAAGEHLTNTLFGAVVLLVLACGARYSDDPRVFLEVDGSRNTLSCGWKWFDQVQMVNKSMMSTPELYEVQFICLFAFYISGTSAPQNAWTITGLGLRMAQDVGAHRQKDQPASVQRELWKRAFWALVVIDRSGSSMLGRACGIYDEDIDVDFPIEVDDEYWENPDPSQAFRQPQGKPSKGLYYTSFLKLNQLMAKCLRILYSTTKSKIALGVTGQKRQQEIVTELDSSLNAWVDSIPEYLRWDPICQNLTHLLQSATLYIGYYNLQILIHRPFIPTPTNPSTLSFPSLAICTNAARCCSHVIDAVNRRGYILPLTGMPIFTSGLVLLLSLWGGNRSGTSIDRSKSLEDVHKCMHWIKRLETRWHYCGRLWDVLYELASVGDLPLPSSISRLPQKRERSGTLEVSLSANGSGRAFPSEEEQYTEQTPVAPSQLSPSLPVHSDELGTFPMHDASLFLTHGDQPLAGPSHRHNWYSNSQTLYSQYENMYHGTPRYTESEYPDNREAGQTGPYATELSLGSGGSGVTGDQEQRTMAMWSNPPTGFQ